jgi:hypothetical protein
LFWGRTKTLSGALQNSALSFLIKNQFRANKSLRGLH